MFVTSGGGLFTWGASHALTRNAALITSSASPLESCSWCVVAAALNPSMQHTWSMYGQGNGLQAYPASSGEILWLLGCGVFLSVLYSVMFNIFVICNFQFDLSLNTDWIFAVAQNVSFTFGTENLSGSHVASLIPFMLDLVLMLRGVMTCAVWYWSLLFKVVAVSLRHVHLSTSDWSGRILGVINTFQSCRDEQYCQGMGSDSRLHFGSVFPVCKNTQIRSALTLTSPLSNLLSLLTIFLWVL